MYKVEQPLNQIFGLTSMKKTTIKFTFIFILFVSGYLETKSQVINSNFDKESISLFTDRTLYSAGEQIQFSAYLISPENSVNISISNLTNVKDLDQLLKGYKKQNSFSNVIYVELITPEGERISGGKYLNTNSGSANCIIIPKNIITGIYYIRAYTKFMRNNGPKTYSYIALKIVNPYKPDILTFNKNNISKDIALLEDSTKFQEFITIGLDKDEYATRERINIQIKGVNLKDNQLRGLNLTVIPDSSLINYGRNEQIIDKPVVGQYYYPETNGISLTGRLKDNKSDKALTSNTVNLSILGGSKDFMATKTDSSGRFFFKMPDIGGVRDVFLSTESFMDSKPTILIDNDFCQSKVRLPVIAFKLSNSERKIAFNQALNIQIASHYNKNLALDSTKIVDKPFYGAPKVELFFDKYIVLPTIEDYVNEFLPSVIRIKKQQGKKYLRIFKDQAEMIIYRPLVLLDMVAIDDPEKILSLQPQKIARMEIIDAPYVKGDITYGGIISIFSKKGDFAGIDLPSSGIFLDFNFWSPCTKNSFDENLPANQPDVRNTILWEPSIILNPNNSKELSFNTSDTPGKYVVLLRGVTNKGVVFNYKKSFVVKGKS
jgi:hypothetical protein